MNMKQIISLVVAAAGLLLAVFAINGMSKLSVAERVIGEAKQALSGHPMEKRLGSSMDMEMRGAAKKVKIALYGGVLLILVGAGGFFYYRKK